MELSSLSTSELMEIEGGKNVVEYLAYGIGYIAGGIAEAFKPDYSITIPFAA